MSTKLQEIYSNGTGPKLNGTQLFFRTITKYNVDNNGKVINSRIFVYYSAKAFARSNTGAGWKSGDIDGQGFYIGGYTLAADSVDKGKTFTPKNYTQEDADSGTIPPGKNIGDPVLSPQAMASLNAPKGVLNQEINNSVINTAVKIKSGLAAQLSAKLKNTPPDPSKTPTGTQPPAGGAAPPAKPLKISTEAKTTQNAGSYNPSGLQAWIYPEDLGNNDQDYIEFQMIEYGGLTEIGKRNFGTNNDGTTKILGRVYLPIQPTISDLNTVDWQNDTINPLQAMGAEVSSSLASIRNSDDKGAMDTIFRRLNDDSVRKYLTLWAAGKAVGTNIFSRFSGAVVNPNLELLFNGPQLRPFNFNFKLSPRSDPEAKTVKGIIRFFKQGMAVRKTEQELFLKAPNVFKIIYRNGKNKEHTSINKIKICALQQCSVDYTPDGSYATFSDKESTMTQYGLTLQFSELEPIFNEDYVDSQSVIGY